MSVRTLYTPAFISDMSPIAMPATGRVMGTPASMSGMELAQTVAIEVEPLDARHSETMRIGYGKISFVGNTARRDFSASAPCPVMRRLNPQTRPVSPTENGGKVWWGMDVFLVSWDSVV